MASSGCSSLHESLEPLQWLMGKWRSEDGKGQLHPTIKEFGYIEEIEFSSVGQPVINYSACSWHSEKKTPLHLESGFFRRKPDTNYLAFMAAHHFGTVSLEEGEFNDHEVTLTSQVLDRMSFATEPRVKKLCRTFRLHDDKLEQIVSMETDNHPFQEHLRATYQKV